MSAEALLDLFSWLKVAAQRGRCDAIGHDNALRFFEALALRLEADRHLLGELTRVPANPALPPEARYTLELIEAALAGPRRESKP